MVDFLKHLKPEVRERILRRRANHAENIAKFSAMPDAEFLERVEYYLKNSTRLHNVALDYPAGDSVYDSIVLHVMIPELIKRVRKHA